MRVVRQLVGTTAGHAAQPATAVWEYRLETGRDLAVTVWTFGATLVEVLVPDRAGQVANVTVRLPDLASYADRRTNPYIGAVLGRYCRCVAGGRFRLDGLEHQLERDDGPHHLHGGPMGFDRFAWQAEAGRDGDALAVRLELDRPDGDQGYPGALSAEVTYRAYPDGRLAISYLARTTATTIVGLTSHAFWNLAGSAMADQHRVDQHRLTVNASRYLPAGDGLIPLPGKPADVAGTSLDYRLGRPLADQGIDDFFALDDPTWAAELSDPVSGRVMRVSTDQPGLGVYTGEGLDPPRAGISLQASAWPDAPNRADYPSCRLDPHDVYRHHTEHRFATR